MKYRFPKSLQVNPHELEAFIPEGEDITKHELLERCSGIISFDLLQYVKELEFEKIGKEANGELYIS